jgi:hypothetical protein
MGAEFDPEGGKVAEPPTIRIVFEPVEARRQSHRQSPIAIAVGDHGQRLRVPFGEIARQSHVVRVGAIERELGPAKDFTTEELREILFKMHGDQIYKPYADGGEVDLMGNPAVVGPQMKGQEMREYMIMNPDVEDVADYLSYYKKLKKEEDSKKAKKRDKAKTRTKKAEGGIMDLDGFEMDLRGGGFVPMGAKEKADDVPARLSKNEFVMTADAVRAAGGGSIDKGADKMYKTMKQLESMV